VGVHYTVEEDTNAGFTVVKEGDTGTIATEDATATFTNKRNTGGLEVKKVVSSAKSSDKSAKYPIKVTLSDTAINTTADKSYGGMTFKNGVAEFELGDQESLKATNLPVGLTYTVEEKLAEGQDDYVVTYSGKTGTIATTPSDATVTNTRTTGDLEVSKSLLSDAADDEGLTAIIANSRSRAKQLAKILAGTAVQQVSDDGRLPSEGVALLDVKLAKGLEFDQVIIPDVQDGAFPDEPIRRHRLYTAISRATKRVTLVANGRLTGLLR
jgi:hypothetical protein